MSEHHEQSALFEWVAWTKAQYPELEMLYAIPNGGLRHKKTAAKLKKEGVQAGVWDLALDVPREGYHGLRIEMKHGRNKLTDNQKIWQVRYASYGYATAVCWSWGEAAKAILGYLGHEVPEDLIA